MLSDKSIELLNQLVQKMFELNRLWDRGLSVLNIDFNMRKFEEVYHDGIAHKYPLLADDVSNILTQKFIKTKYYNTPDGIKDYLSPLDFFEDSLELHKKTMKILCDTINSVQIDGDVVAETELQDFATVFDSYVHQNIYLIKKYNEYKGNNHIFDIHCDEYYIIGGGD